MIRPFLLGVLATVVLGVVVAVLVVASGVVDVSATKAGGIQDRILAYASTRSIAHHARREQNPLTRDPAALKAGLQEYREMCVTCHGAPGVDAEEFAAGLHPAAPDLASHEVQSFTDGMLYETVAGGIGSTGMPGFGRTHKPGEIWSIVAFVRHLPALTPEEKSELARKELQPDEAEAAPPPSERTQGQGGATASAAPAGPGQHVHRVSISNFKFVPATLDLHAGDVVEWKNTDFVAHSATADDGGFDTGRIEGGEAKRVVVTKRGRLSYYCRYHTSMKGMIVAQ
jgi:plastocyanin/mono/diheme cytochrome c family protein